MEALTINNLAPYLPHGLKVIFNDIYTPSGICEMLSCNYEGECDLENSYGEVYPRTWPEFIKPICFPLSDLTKPITINGETFVPIEKLFQMAYYSVYDSFFEGEFDENQLLKDNLCLKCQEPNVAGGFWKYGFSVELPNWFRFSVNGDYLTIPNFTMYEKLFEWKFAINLPEGSWIPVTEEFNPYK